MKKLYEIKNDYTCHTDSIYQEFGSFDNYLEEFADAEDDLNLVFRWDWITEEPDSQLSDWLYDCYQYLKIFIIQQRKGLLRQIIVKNINHSNEQEIRSYLEKKKIYLFKNLWDLGE